MFADISAAYLKINIIKMKTAKEITKRSTLLATIRSEFPKSTAIDLENELFEMINKTLMLGSVVEQSEQLKAFLQEIENEKTYILNDYYKNKAKRLRESI